MPVRFTNNAVFRLRTAEGDFALRIHRPDYRTVQCGSTASTLFDLVCCPLLERLGECRNFQ
jgi:Ser/Thr protein kinase RdoA (MazF antagonist)